MNIKLLIKLPDYYHLPIQLLYWDRSIYGNYKEVILIYFPIPKVTPIVLTHYIDDNLLHYMISGKYVTLILNFINQYHINWY